jgi:hypothetical protein
MLWFAGGFIRTSLTNDQLFYVNMALCIVAVPGRHQIPDQHLWLFLGKGHSWSVPSCEPCQRIQQVCLLLHLGTPLAFWVNCAGSFTSSGEYYLLQELSSLVYLVRWVSYFLLRPPCSHESTTKLRFGSSFLLHFTNRLPLVVKPIWPYLTSNRFFPLRGIESPLVAPDPERFIVSGQTLKVVERPLKHLWNFETLRSAYVCYMLLHVSKSTTFISATCNHQSSSHESFSWLLTTPRRNLEVRCDQSWGQDAGYWFYNNNWLVIYCRILSITRLSLGLHIIEGHVCSGLKNNTYLHHIHIRGPSPSIRYFRQSRKVSTGMSIIWRIGDGSCMVKDWRWNREGCEVGW